MSTTAIILFATARAIPNGRGRSKPTATGTVVVVPLFLAQGEHLKRDLPAMVASIRERHTQTEFRIAPALGDSPEIVAAITQWVQRTTS